MKYLYLDLEANKIFSVSKRKLEKGNPFNQDHHTELVVNDDFVITKTLVDENGNPKISDDGKLIIEDKTASEILNEINYVDKRIAEYPSITDQLDMLWHAMDDGLLPKDNSFYNSIKQVKDSFPK